MKLALILVAFVIFGVWQKNKVRWTASNQLPVSRDPAMVDSCAQKRMCAVVYLAPWCPACQQVTPTLMTFLANAQKSKLFGLQVIIGAGRKAGENEKKANALGMGTMVDNDNKIANALGVTYYPTFIVIDNKRSVTLRDQAAMEWANSQFAGP
ncbi:MAG: redoxin domain-containing protein [Bdellovibrionales bacterium]|nr:redoxin domain-containing protein [Bdellovibrionales bacterium]